MEQGASQPNASKPDPRVISSDTLLQGRRVVIIRHGPDDYRLQVTGGGKLILTK